MVKKIFAPKLHVYIFRYRKCEKDIFGPLRPIREVNHVAPPDLPSSSPGISSGRPVTRSCVVSKSFV